MKILSVVGARPNFMKIAPFVRAITEHNRAGKGCVIEHSLVHTGQHYDDSMSKTFFDSLGIPEPDVDLGVGSGSHAEQVGRTMIAFEAVVRRAKPSWIVVVGDVNATCACSITAKKEHVKLAHIEAGLRSFDMRMPEEVNRLVTDRLSDLLFTPDAIADENLRAEGVPAEKILRVGNIMIDTLEDKLPEAARLSVEEIVAANRIRGASAAGPTPVLGENGFAVLTLHRPSNVDSREVIEPLVRFFIEELSRQVPLLWTVHPRTRKQLQLFGLWERIVAEPRILLLEPLGYLEMLRLNMGARVLLTDSGGLQEECCVLGTPCITLRENTERPVTLAEHGGLSRLAGNRVSRIRECLAASLSGVPGASKRPARPPLWDGKTAERIVEAFARLA